MLEKAHLPHFADWRWNTLTLALKSVSPMLDSLILRFDATPFASSRDRAGLNEVLSAFGSKEWRVETDFVYWFCRWLSDLMQWGSGCTCHDRSLAEGASLDCPWKGRRLAEASGHISEWLNRGLHEANLWTPTTFGTSLQHLLEMQGAVRTLWSLGLRKWAFLDRVPYLFVRLDQPGVKAVCLAQWASARPEEHHRLTQWFMLRADIDQLGQDGLNMPRRLQNEINGLKAMPFDDSVAEGPHAVAKRVLDHSRSASWPWVASSCRVRQNLVDVRNLLPAVGGNLQSLWSANKTVVRVTERDGQEANLRMPYKKFLNYVYRMSFCCEHDAQEAGADDDGGSDGDGHDGGGGGDGPGGGGGGKISKGGRRGNVPADGNADDEGPSNLFVIHGTFPDVFSSFQQSVL